LWSQLKVTFAVASDAEYNLTGTETSPKATVAVLIGLALIGALLYVVPGQLARRANEVNISK
jgi:hypothetical protein